MTRRFSQAAAFLAVLAFSSASFADATSERAGELYSVEKRNILGNHELSISLGTLPLDAFGAGLTLSGGYAYHFSQMLGWEIAGGTYSFIIGTGLRKELLDRFDAQPDQNSGDLQAMVHSNVIFKPLYGKIALLNDTLSTAELYFVLGPSIGFFTDDSRPFGFDFGVGFRLFLNEYFSVKLDIRDYVFFPDASNHLFLSLGVSLTFGFSDSGDDDA